MQHIPMHAITGFAAGLTLGALLWRQQATAQHATTDQDAVACKDEGAEGEDELILCAMCSHKLPPLAFSAKQLRKRAGWRKPKCQKCIDSYEHSGNTAGAKVEGHQPRKPKSKSAAASVAPSPAPRAPPLVATAAATPRSAEQPAEQPDFDDVTDPLRKARKAEAVLRARTERVLLVLENCSDDLNHVAILRTCESLGVHRIWLIEANAAVDLPRVWGEDAHTEGAAEHLAEHNPHHDGPNSLKAASADCSTAAQSRARLRLQARAAQRGFDFDPLLGVRRAQHYCTHLDVRRFPNTAACLAALREDGRTLWVTDLDQEAIPLSSGSGELRLSLPERVAIVLGSEGAGVSEAMLAAADQRVYLPMFGFTESFNLSVSAALVLQRLLDACPESRGDLPEAEIRETRLRWYTQLAKTDAQRADFVALANKGGAEPLKDVRRPPAHRAEQKRYTRNAETKRKLIEGGVIPTATAAAAAAGRG